jgi:hypothetical protein
MGIKFVFALLLFTTAAAGASEHVMFITKIDGPAVTVLEDENFHEVLQIEMDSVLLKIDLETGQEFFQTAEWEALFSEHIKTLIVYSGWGAGRIRSRLLSISSNKKGLDCLFDFVGSERVQFRCLTNDNHIAATVQDNGKVRQWNYTSAGGKVTIVPQG